jgi:hypothetical protein
MEQVIEVEQDNSVYNGSKSDEAVYQNFIDRYKEAVSNKDLGTMERLEPIIDNITLHRNLYLEKKQMRKARIQQHKTQQLFQHLEAVEKKKAEVPSATLTPDQKAFCDMLGKCESSLMPTKHQQKVNHDIMVSALKGFKDNKQFLSFCQSFIASKQGEKIRTIAFGDLAKQFIREYIKFNNRQVTHKKIIEFYNYSKTPTTNLIMEAVNKFFNEVPKREARKVDVLGLNAMARKSKRARKILLNSAQGKKNSKLYKYTYKRNMNFVERFLHDNRIRLTHNVGMTITAERDLTAKTKVIPISKKVSFKSFQMKYRSSNQKVTDRMIEAEHGCLRSFAYKYHNKEFEISGYRCKSQAQNILYARAKKIQQFTSTETKDKKTNKTIKKKSIDAIKMIREAEKQGLEFDFALHSNVYDKGLINLYKHDNLEYHYNQLNNSGIETIKGKSGRRESFKEFMAKCFAISF